MKRLLINNRRLGINKHNSVYIILIVLSVVTYIYSPQFMTGGTILNMLRQASALGVLTAGQLFVIVGGGVDLSVVATMQMAIVIYSRLINRMGTAGLIIGILLSLVLGIGMGLFNGVVITKFRLQPFLVTIFTAHILTGSRMIFTGVDSAGVVPDAIRFLGNESTGPIPNAVIIMFLVIILSIILLNKTIFGRQLVAVGSNRLAAVFSGINADATIIKSYCYSGIMAVLASILLAGYTGYADMWIGEGFEFNSLVAAVIGGNFLGGGRGSVLGMLGGVLVTTLVLNIVLVFGLDVTFQYVFTGLIFLIATLMGSLATAKSN
jgi:ribose/xylose/arabinose/galactoside ABC-type transport system permease subunit